MPFITENDREQHPDAHGGGGELAQVAADVLEREVHRARAGVRSRGGASARRAASRATPGRPPAVPRPAVRPSRRPRARPRCRPRTAPCGRRPTCRFARRAQVVTGTKRVRPSTTLQHALHALGVARERIDGDHGAFVDARCRCAPPPPGRWRSARAGSTNADVHIQLARRGVRLQGDAGDAAFQRLAGAQPDRAPAGRPATRATTDSSTRAATQSVAGSTRRSTGVPGATVVPGSASRWVTRASMGAARRLKAACVSATRASCARVDWSACRAASVARALSRPACAALSAAFEASSEADCETKPWRSRSASRRCFSRARSRSARARSTAAGGGHHLPRERRLLAADCGATRHVLAIVQHGEHLAARTLSPTSTATEVTWR